jgi:RND family efflux transporter MFP subunit
MKNILQILVFATLGAATVTSCGGGEQTELQKISAERDSLRTVRDGAEARIQELDAIIANLDTTVERALVTTYMPSVNTFHHYFEVYGNVDTDKAATLYPEVPGMVQQIVVSEGDFVKRGQVLIKLDSEVLSRNIAELNTSLELANVLYDKQKRLWEQNVGSEVQYLEAKNRKEALENSIATIQEQANKTTVRAPFDGVVDKIFPKVGEIAQGQLPVARIVNLDNVYVTAEVSERYVGKVRAGDQVQVIVNRTDTILSKIARVGTFINSNNRTFEIKVEMDGVVKNVKPNSLVVLKINDYSRPEAIAIPSSLIMQDGQGSDYVFVVESNGSNTSVAKKRNITTGMRYMGTTLIEQGLDLSTPIIDKGSRSVREGDVVEIIKM